MAEPTCETCGNQVENAQAECPWCLADPREVLGGDLEVDEAGVGDDCPVTEIPPEVLEAGADERYGNYIRVSLLGKGGMGEVWKAWDLPLGRWVALKFLVEVDPRELAVFQGEAQAAGALAHPNIAAVYGIGEARGLHFIAMQFVDGETVRNAPPKDRRAGVALVRDAARAVAFVHRHGIVHRDLKPENLMVTPDGHLYVMDFGLAHRNGIGEAAAGGTPRYMSEAQIRGEAPTVKDDIFALGCTLHELLVGAPPKVRQISRKVPRPLAAVIDRCLAGRYESASDLADDLGRYLARRRRVLAVAAAAVVAIVAGGLVTAKFEHDRRATAEAVERERQRTAEEFERQRAAIHQAEYWRGVGENLLKAKDDQKAIDAFSKSLAANPEAKTFLFRGFAHWRKSNYPAAIADCDAALRLDPDNAAAKKNRAMAQDAWGRAASGD